MPDRVAEAELTSFYASSSREFALASENEGLVEYRLRFADRSVRLRFAGTRLAETLFSPLAEHRVENDGAVDASIDLWEASSQPFATVPFPWRRSELGPGGLVRGSDFDGLVAVHEPFSGAVTLFASHERTVLHRVPHSGSVPWWERAAPMRPALFWALGGVGRHIVHAAAVGDVRGGVLLVGTRGSGKTTVALSAVRHGLRFVADDYLLLDVTGGLDAISLYSTASSVAGPHPEEKTVQDLASKFPDAMCGAIPIRAVVAPRMSGGKTRLRRISPVTALRAWAPSTIRQMPYDGDAVLASLALVVRRVPCFGLDVGGEETGLADAISRVLDQVTL